MQLTFGAAAMLLAGAVFLVRLRAGPCHVAGDATANPDC
jgi:hypothetical protein